MKIDFTLTEEDYLDITKLNMKNSKKFKLSYIAQRYVIPLLFAIVIHNIFSFLGTIGSILLSVAIYIAWVIFFPKYYKNSTIKRLKKINTENGTGSLFDKCSIDISREGIVSSDSSGSIRRNWNKVNKVKETDKFLLIYVDKTNYSVFPLRAFKDEEERNTFMTILKKHCTVEEIEATSKK